MIDKDLVQKMIEEEIGFDFEIYKYYDTEPYVIIEWKHKSYDIDDERGQFIGCGPVIYDKEKKEYKVLGSGEWFYGDYADYLIPEKSRLNEYEIISNCLNEKIVEIKDKNWLINKIKNDIRRREYVNSEDIDWICILFGARNTKIRFDMKFQPGYDMEKHCLVIFDDKEIQNKLVEIWKELNLPFEIISKTNLVLWKTKTCY